MGNRVGGRRTKPRQNGSKCRMVVARFTHSACGIAPVVSSEGGVNSHGMRVVDAVMHGPDERTAMEMRCQSRQMLAQRDACHRRCNGLEFTAALGRTIWFHVP